MSPVQSVEDVRILSLFPIRIRVYGAAFMTSAPTIAGISFRKESCRFCGSVNRGELEYFNSFEFLDLSASPTPAL